MTFPKNISLELGVIIGNQTKNRRECDGFEFCGRGDNE